MRKFFNNFKKSCKRFMTGKSGFSLVELIVVIAIMAVMAAVLVPALLGYVEKSRMQKDDSATDEIVAAIHVALADQSIYDEVLEHSVWDNVSCYIDKKDESQFTDCKVQLKAEHGDKKEQYMFGDEARLLDETVYYAAGNMRGLTITWSPNESGDTYDFSKGILNKFVGRKTGLLSENPELYNRLRSVIGDKLDTTSQTYRNSDYTIFIRVGSTGGSEAVMQDAIQVWGQFNGTNLTEKDHKYELSSGRVVGKDGENDFAKNEFSNQYNEGGFSETSDLKHENIVQFGATYITVDGETISPGQPFPKNQKHGDTYIYEDYEYRLSNGSWIVTAIDKTKTKYGDILTVIGTKPTKQLRGTFKDCTNLTSDGIPTLPNDITIMSNTFENCSSITDLGNLKIPDGVTNLYRAFHNCTAMTRAPKLPNGVLQLGLAFHSCKLLKEAPEIPNTVTGMTQTFYNCESLISVKNISTSVTDMGHCFYGCTSLVTVPVIPNGVTVINSAFSNCKSLKEAPIIPNSVKNMDAAFYNCNSLIVAPTIPLGVENVVSAFAHCEKLTTPTDIPQTVTNMENIYTYSYSVTGTIRIPCSLKEQPYGNSKNLHVEYYHIDSCDDSCGV